MTEIPKIVLFECNELPFQVVDHFINGNPGSHVARILGRSKQFETVCEDQVELDPWISWPTLHRGVIDEQHHIFHLGQSLEHANRAFPPLWQLLAERGISVGIMGSLHTSTPPASLDNYRFYVPDFFSASPFAHPARLQRFQAFNLAMTRKSARNVDTGLAWKEALRFVATYPFNGLSLATVKGTLSEIAGELRARHLKCRRRAVQPMITLDVFLREMRRSLPRFATLHTNHVAAAMHRFWAATFPDDVPDNAMPGEWHGKYRHEIDYAMRVFDMMLGRLAAFVEQHPGYRLLVAGSLGQAGIRTDETKGFYTITDLERFMRMLGVARHQWTQRFAMVPCLSVVVDAGAADAFEARLAGIAADGHRMAKTVREQAPLSYSREANSFQLYVYFERYKGSMQAEVQGNQCGFVELGLGFHEHQDDVACSARHTPRGMLAVYDPRRPAADRTRSCISTLDIAPALLSCFGVTPPAYMNPADPAILDTTAVGTAVELRVTGGGVEMPVTRLRTPEATVNP